MEIGVADGALVTPCDLGSHDWELVGTESEQELGEAYDWGPTTTSTWRCRVCGATEKRVQRPWR